MENYSVLMSVYCKEHPEYLKQSMESIYNQTVPTNDFVLVCDGPLGNDLNEIIEEMKMKFGYVLNVLQLDKNIGLGGALQAGLKICKNDLVARMDSDDIARIDRCSRELEAFSENENLSIVSGTIEEFVHDPKKTYARRVLPEKHKEIVEFAKFRCPFNHPCVMFRKSSVEAAGGYLPFYHVEDYYLWIRMLLNGCIGMNIQEPLLWMRAGNNMYKRRSGWKYIKSQIALFRFMKEKKFITNSQYIKNSLIRCGSSIAPNKIRKLFYKKILRE